jgi:formylglycine-generating enzyme required for sulfatase activity
LRGFRLPIVAVVFLAAAAFALRSWSRELPDRWVEPSTEMEFMLLRPGDFVAGSPSTEIGHQEDEVLYPVRIARPLYMGTHEVTRGQWAAVMTPGVAVAPDEAHLPVVNITWHEARAFVDRLNSGQPWRLRLPSEVEWEYACRAGTTTPYHTGASLSTNDANYNGDDPVPGHARGENRQHAMPVGSFPPNAWGLFDLHGNVWEWTNDAYDETRKVIRGGSWRFNAGSARCALRHSHEPQARGDSLGLRLVRDLTKEEAER